MGDLRESLLDAEAELGSREAAWRLVLAVVAAAHGLREPPADAVLVRSWAEPGAAEHLGAVHESSVPRREASGTFYTPAALVAWVLDRALEPLLSDGADVAPRILDPSCGSGAFLVAVVRRITERTGLAASAVVPSVHGTDLDPVAVAITRLLLRIEAPDVDPARLPVRVGDGLSAHPDGPFDVVVGNPPFLGRLRRRTSSPEQPTSRPGAYTDTSALFLRRSLELVRPGGRVALVQPLSLLGARDAAPVRAAVVGTGALVAFWASATPVFTGTDVSTCAPVVEVGGRQAAVSTWHGARFERGADVVMPADQWGPLAAPGLGVPAVVLPADTGRLGDVASCTADFRDQYYGLVPFVREGGDGAPLITSGLIDPAESRWGQAPTRFAKTAFLAPTVDLEALRAEESGARLAAWAAARLVPKVLVGTQGRVIEAVVDVEGRWLPSVPVITVVPAPDRLWHVLAVLLAPPVAAHAAARYLGTAMSARAVKLSAGQVADLPLPRDHVAWGRGADLARAAQTGPSADRAEALAACARTMGDAYGAENALEWWRQRAVRD